MEGGPPAGFSRRLHRRRLERDRACSIRSWTTGRRDLRGRGGRPWPRLGPARGVPLRRAPRRAARQPHLPAAGRGRSDPGGPFDLGRPRLSGHRSRACMAARDRAGSKYISATDKEALEAFKLCSKLEGILPALEPAHALAKVVEIAPTKPKDHLMVVNIAAAATRTSRRSPRFSGAGLARAVSRQLARLHRRDSRRLREAESGGRAKGPTHPASLR